METRIGSCSYALGLNYSALPHGKPSLLYSWLPSAPQYLGLKAVGVVLATLVSMSALPPALVCYGIRHDSQLLPLA